MPIEQQQIELDVAGINLGTRKFLPDISTVRKKSEKAALDWFLLEYPEDLSYDDILEYFAGNLDLEVNIRVDSDYEGYDLYDLGQMIENKTSFLQHFANQLQEP
jgi:hypothetical protein